MDPPRTVPTNRLLFRDIARMRATLFDRMLEPLGLTSSQSSVIGHLYREDGLTQSELAAPLGIGAVAAGGLVERLEARGLVARRPCQRDRRANRVRLDPSAYPLLDAIADAIAEIDAVAFAGLSAGEVAALETTLRHVRGNLKSALKGGLCAAPPRVAPTAASAEHGAPQLPAAPTAHTSARPTSAPPTLPQSPPSTSPAASASAPPAAAPSARSSTVADADRAPPDSGDIKAS
ncbi:MarR family winged helix-turn-helix transcriptional regulator [Acuticoccus yangtzensis]|uniref:MarR family winged helix-turn-helix transcriptional regulator n=1 Tax=Acuticoccus yangtzensis TaxID=1443441 RepID=UPI000A6D9CF1|nr:MarR family transcriptional regulator [Acuticoccus yangtzensis]